MYTYWILEREKMLKELFSKKEKAALARVWRGTVYENLVNTCLRFMNIEESTNNTIGATQYEEVGNKVIEMAEFDGYKAEVKKENDGKARVVMIDIRK